MSRNLKCVLGFGQVLAALPRKSCHLPRTVDHDVAQIQAEAWVLDREPPVESLRGVWRHCGIDRYAAGFVRSQQRVQPGQTRPREVGLKFVGMSKGAHEHDQAPIADHSLLCLGVAST
jgi:hypothetical protein